MYVCTKLLKQVFVCLEAGLLIPPRSCDRVLRVENASTDYDDVDASLPDHLAWTVVLLPELVSHTAQLDACNITVIIHRSSLSNVYYCSYLAGSAENLFVHILNYQFYHATCITFVQYAFVTSTVELRVTVLIHQTILSFFVCQLFPILTSNKRYQS